MKDANRYLVSNATITASYNSSALDLNTVPGAPMRGFEFTGYITQGGNINNTATAAANVTVMLQESSDTAFTSVPNTRVVEQMTFTVGTGTTNPSAITLPFKMTQEFLRAVVIPGAGVTLNGWNVQQDCARTP
jgi:hypothetical protein